MTVYQDSEDALPLDEQEILTSVRERHLMSQPLMSEDFHRTITSGNNILVPLLSVGKSCLFRMLFISSIISKPGTNYINFETIKINCYNNISSGLLD